MLVTIKNGVKTLSLNATERRQIAAVKKLLDDMVRDYAIDGTEFKTKMTTAGTTLAQIEYITKPEVKTEVVAAGK